MSIRIAVCVDDTDDLTKVTSTGKVADELGSLVQKLGGKTELGVTRHQLPILEKIEYTSHNSSMCFTATLPNEEALLEYHKKAEQLVVEGSVEAADPGLCIFRFPDLEDRRSLKLLISYGIHAKEHYVTKAEAYKLAAAIPTLSLVELGGGGEGIIGALAGVALRLSGSDGRFRGRDRIEEGSEPKTVAELVDILGGEESAQVCGPDQAPLDLEVSITVPDKIRSVLLDGKKTTFAEMGDDGVWHVLDAQTVKDRFDKKPRWRVSCEKFEFDNDCEEFADAAHEELCSNCLYRRWVEGGFSCMINSIPSAVEVA